MPNRLQQFEGFSGVVYFDVSDVAVLTGPIMSLVVDKHYRVVTLQWGAKVEIADTAENVARILGADSRS